MEPITRSDLLKLLAVVQVFLGMWAGPNNGREGKAAATSVNSIEQPLVQQFGEAAFRLIHTHPPQ